jgi:protein-S-isoprenylcysteine O-methyltransferase Ste14
MLVKLLSSQTPRGDWKFIFSASLIFVLALLVTSYDYVQSQRSVGYLGIVQIAGLILSCMGILLRVVARKTLGKYFSSRLRISEEHKLIKNGIYKYIRHPAYLGSLLFSIGVPMLFLSLYGTLLMLGLFPLFLYRIRIEERMLIEKFGAKYRKYMEKTKKIIPFIY